MMLATRLSSFRRILLLGAVLCVSAVPALAQQQTTDGPTMSTVPPLPSVPVIERNDTRALLQIQRSGAQAGPGLPMTGEQAALGYERYLESFRYAIPESFTSQATGSPLRRDGGGGGSQSLGQAMGQ
ncbi:DUF3613 domain-containing protein [Cupriavidus plantarum]|uniref:DUF3613 domain-containing protein n=1 Tax=Cupriavidus plantarum TaxID=942865 RepID=UPI00183BC397|nr:DUF3613 domain-containing protein [Cupriavidus plantarum]NYI01325.1 hypothetical protein [Cupriavidus plantarum]